MKSNSGFGGWRSVLVLACAASIGLSGCAAVKPAAVPTGEAPASMEKVGDLNRLTLTDKAVERLGLTTEKVTKGSALEVPYGALIYDGAGKTWVYTNPEPKTYIRAAVIVDKITGSKVQLRSGPPAGTDVVTVGAAELFGAEFGTKGH
ncbi:hypothetical protein [Arthrobacter sp. ISL-28]|uniref:hypothetical protein n=1 Tax=Arthrobacter sp. ISL-28 TaxID=2819108 RepID=UPI001BECDEDF|nr:hypothetical protein [Arthrobacter sp. ISL-28]MBT2520806.1 hypothetical protein [Arthrobacter sp. ISL-28]